MGSSDSLLLCQKCSWALLWQVLERKVPIAGVSQHKIDNYLRTLLKEDIIIVKQDQASFFLPHALPHALIFNSQILDPKPNSCKDWSSGFSPVWFGSSEQQHGCSQDFSPLSRVKQNWIYWGCGLNRKLVICLTFTSAFICAFILVPTLNLTFTNKFVQRVTSILWYRFISHVMSKVLCPDFMPYHRRNAIKRRSSHSSSTLKTNVHTQQMDIIL